MKAASSAALLAVTLLFASGGALAEDKKPADKKPAAPKADEKKKKGAADRGLEFMVAPAFIKGRQIQPGDHPPRPVLFVFCFPESSDAKTDLKKLDAAVAKLGNPAVRVVVVGSGMNSSALASFMRSAGAGHLEGVADPLGIMQAQCGFSVSKDNPWQLRSLSPEGKIAAAPSAEAFLKEAAASQPDKPAAKAKPASDAEPAAARSAKLKDCYQFLDEGRTALALAHFRPYSKNQALDAPVRAEAQAMVDKLVEERDAKLRELRAATSDQYSADLEDAKAVLLPKWKDDPESRGKVEDFIKEWTNKDEVKNEAAARKMRLQLWKYMASEKVDHAAVKSGFESLAKKYFNTPTGIQAAALAKLIK